MKVEEALNSAVKEAEIDAEGVVHLICGSIARLEYIPGQSDFDFTIIFQDQENKLEKSEEPAILEKFESLLRSRIRFRIAKMEKRLRESFPDFSFPERRRKNISVEVDCILRGGGKNFILESDLFDHVGKYDEATYAPLFRSHLLQENLFLAGDSEFHTHLQLRAEELYGASSDMREDEFPSLCYTFFASLMWSGIVAKASHVRSEESTVSDHLIGKTLLGRVWVSRLNLVALHMLFWKQVFSGKMGREEVLTTLQSPTLAKVAFVLPDLLNDIDSALLEWVRIFERNERTKILNQIQECLMVFASCFNQDITSIGKAPYGTGQEIPLTRHFREVLSICLGVRLEKKERGAFDGPQIAKIQAANSCLNEVLQAAQELTKMVIEKKITSATGRPSYANFRVMMPADILP